MRTVAVFVVLAAGAYAVGNASRGDAAGTKADAESAVAIFAGGCFWCMEGPFDELPGVLSTTSGYTDGHVANPSYAQVSAGTTGHTEAVQIRYDPARISYAALLKVFWPNIDPTTPDRQFCDHGSQYRPAIFYADDAQRDAALASLQDVEQSKPFKDAIRIQILAATVFYPAEDYHQDYYLKNPIRYKFYRYNCGRDQRLKMLWGDDD